MIQIVNKKRFTLIILIAAAIIGAAIWGIVKFKNRNNPENKPQAYEALVNVVDQKASDPVEDARSSLKKGDVIAYFPEGHSWSDTEKNSYLIVKIKLKSEDAAKLMEAETKEKKVEGSTLDKEKNMGPQTETVVARKYRLDLPNFDLQKFWGGGGQPFRDKIFDSGMIQKK